MDRLFFKPLLRAAAGSLCEGEGDSSRQWNALLRVQRLIEGGYNRGIVLRLAPITKPHGKAIWVPWSPGFKSGYRSVAELERAVSDLQREAKALAEALAAEMAEAEAAALLEATDALLADWAQQWQLDAAELGKCLAAAPGRSMLMAGIQGGLKLKKAEE